MSGARSEERLRIEGRVGRSQRGQSPGVVDDKKTEEGCMDRGHSHERLHVALKLFLFLRAVEPEVLL